jgi:hypothetical protein
LRPALCAQPPAKTFYYLKNKTKITGFTSKYNGIQSKRRIKMFKNRVLVILFVTFTATLLP